MIPVRGRGIVIVEKTVKGKIAEDVASAGETAHTGTYMPTEGRNRHMVESSFSVIEKKISDIAGMVVALKKEKAALAAQLEKKEAEVKDLTRKVAELTEERNEIRDKVETILARIESIEL